MSMLQMYAAFIFALMIVVGTVASYGIALELAKFSFPPVTVRKVGGLYHWRIGRIGGSIYVAKVR
jgi:hypothetical protein